MSERTRGLWARPELVVIARLGIGAMWIYLALANLADPPLFLKSLEGYGMLPTEPPALLNAIAIVISRIDSIMGFELRDHALHHVLQLFCVGFRQIL